MKVMKLSIEDPSRAYITGVDPAEFTLLRKVLTYTNTAIGHDIKRISNNHWYRSKSPDKWKAEIDDLKARQKRTLIFEQDGRRFIRPGSIAYLTDIEVEADNLVNYPNGRPCPWAKKPKYELYDYQSISVEKLIAAKHASVELCTGAGKSLILLTLARTLGLRTAVVVPSKSIFEEQHESFLHHFGAAKVGCFGDGKKKLGKQITVCIGDSLANLVPGTKEWDFFQTVQVLLVDEAHLWGAETLEDTCYGALANVPYRMFVSGTLTRGDGSEKLLQGIVGPVVHTLQTWEAVQGGYICPQEFTMVKLPSTAGEFYSPNPMEMKRKHLLGNRNVAAFAAKLANSVATIGQQTLILVEELPQIAMLIPLLKVPFAYAHAEKRKERLEELGLEKVNPSDSVEKFNKNEVKVLIGTSCISTGTNIYPTHHVVNWVGGASEIKTKQGAVGRAIRLGKSNEFAHMCAPKEKTTIYDFDVYDVDILHRHFELRLGFYRESFPPTTDPAFRWIRL